MTDVPCGTDALLRRLEAAVIAENQHQNLISGSTVGEIRSRHIEDSLQLAPLVSGTAPLLDIGSGAGFPGLVLACLADRPVHLIEPRRRRADFLQHAAAVLGLKHVTVHQARIETLCSPPAGVFTARAVAPLSRLLEMSTHLATEQTRWVLLKGRTAKSELDAARATWHGQFELIPSRTDPAASIVVATGVRRRRSA